MTRGEQVERDFFTILDQALARLHSHGRVTYKTLQLQVHLDVTRYQEAKALELRVAMGLSRLWQQQGKQAEAQALLVPVYGWFTEGFDTADLQEARVLSEELAG